MTWWRGGGGGERVPHGQARHPRWKSRSVSPSPLFFTPSLSSALASSCSGVVAVQVMPSRDKLWGRFNPLLEGSKVP